MLTPEQKSYAYTLILVWLCADSAGSYLFSVRCDQYKRLSIVQYEIYLFKLSIKFALKVYKNRIKWDHLLPQESNDFYRTRPSNYFKSAGQNKVQKYYIQKTNMIMNQYSIIFYFLKLERQIIIQHNYIYKRIIS